MGDAGFTKFANPVFGQAVEAVDEGDVSLLKDILSKQPGIIAEQAHFPKAGYFEKPYLLYFVADNPIRNGKLPANVLEVMNLLIGHLQQYPANSKQAQLEYTLGLIASGSIPRESGKQIAMMDLLLDAGAAPGEGLAALAHGNIDAARHLIHRGGRYTLVAAACFNEEGKINTLFAQASEKEKITAMTAAAFYGFPNIIALLLDKGANPNGYPSGGFHTHATSLHQAVYSGVLASVQLLVEAGADLQAKDKAYGGTPLGWAQYMQEEEAPDEEIKSKYKIIEAYLRQQS